MSRYARDFQFNDNFELMAFELSVPYEFPVIEAEPYVDGFTWIGYNYARSKLRTAQDLSGFGVHFYLDDYQFERVWRSLRLKAKKLQLFGAILSPDFSIWADWPMPQQMWNHYKAQFVGAYLQRCGMLVYPSVNWGGADTFNWCFSGVEPYGCVAVSSVGTQMNDGNRKAFKYGYDAMLERVQPSAILFHGKVPSDCRGNIVPIEPFQTRLRKRCKDD